MNLFIYNNYIIYHLLKMKLTIIGLIFLKWKKYCLIWFLSGFTFSEIYFYILWNFLIVFSLIFYHSSSKFEDSIWFFMKLINEQSYKFHCKWNVFQKNPFLFNKKKKIFFMVKKKSYFFIIFEFVIVFNLLLNLKNYKNGNKN